METSGFSGASQPPYRSGGSRHLFFAVVLILVSIAGSAAVGYYFYYSHSIGDAPKTTSSTPSVAVEAVEIENPVEFFYKNFSSRDYRVNSVRSAGDQDSSFYYQKGVLVRIDTKGKYSNTTLIIKNDKLFVINEKDKTFVEMSVNDPKAVYILEMFKSASLLDPILQSDTPTATPWSRMSQDGLSENILKYQTTGRKVASYTVIDIQITLDLQTGLISEASMKRPKDEDWTAVSFQYELVSDIESLKSFPRDYKKVDPI